MEAARDMVHPGETFWVRAHVCVTAESLPEAAFVSFLDLGIGEYWFYPSWAHYPPDIDYVLRSFATGLTTIEVIPELVWPDVQGSLDGIRIWGALLDPDLTAIIGEYGYVEFGYAESRFFT
jgi:hypothetical protein